MSELSEKLAKALVNIKNSAINQYEQGAPYRNALASALQGDIQPATQLFNTPQPVNPNEALDAAMAFAPMGLGTIGKVANKLTKYEQNHLTAQKNAVQMLGLSANNTAMERAKAMGYDTPAYHGTNADVAAFNVNGQGKTNGSGAFFTNNPDIAGTYTHGINNGNIIPALLRNENQMLVNANGKNWNRLDNKTNINAPKITKVDNETEALLAQLEDRAVGSGISVTKKPINKSLRALFPEEMKYKDDYMSTDDLARWANKEGYGGVSFNNVKDQGPTGALSNSNSMLPSNNYAVFNPANIRSRFAAFDPARAHEADILGYADPRLLSGIGAGTGAGLLGANYLKDKK